MDKDTNKKYTHSDRYIRLGLNIAYYRKLRGLTQMELAEKVSHIKVSLYLYKLRISLYYLFDSKRLI